MDERAVQIMLRFGMEGKSVDDARAKLKQAAAEFQKLEKEAQATRKEISKALAHGKDAQQLEQELQQIEAAMKDIGDAARKYISGQAKQSFSQLREMGERMQAVGTPFTIQGLAIFAGVGQAIRQYTQYVGQTTNVSAKWLNATRELEQSYMRVGAVATERLLPVMEKLADLASDIASFVEQHPEVVDSALKVATAMLAVGGGLQIAGGLMKMAGSAGALGQYMGLGSAGGALAGGSISAMVTAIVPVAVAATLAYLANKTALPEYRASTFGGGQEGRRSALQNYFNAQFGQDKTTSPTSNLADTFDRVGESAEEAAPKIEQLNQAIIPAAAVEAYVQYRKAEQQAEEEYGRQRSQVVEEYARQRAEIELRYEQQRTQIVEDFARQQAQALADFNRMQAEANEDFLAAEAQYEQDYNQQRADAAADLQNTLAELEQNFKRRMRQLERQHQQRMEDLAFERDALGMVQEQRRYNEERRQAVEEYRQSVADARKRYQQTVAELDRNYQLEKQRRAQAFAEQQADQAEQFAIMRAREQEEQKLRLERLDAQYKAELQKLEENKNITLRELTDQYRRERELRRRAFTEQLYQLGVFQNAQLVYWQAFYANMTTELQTFIATMEAEVASLNSTTTPTNTTARAAGGYATFGRYILGEQGTEYVLNAQTTRALERSLGRGITQEKILAYLSAPRGPVDQRAVITVSQNFSFSGALTTKERQWFRQVARQEAQAGVLNALGA